MKPENPSQENANDKAQELKAAQPQLSVTVEEIGPIDIRKLAADIQVLAKHNLEFRKELKEDPDGCVRRRLLKDSGGHLILPAITRVIVVEDTANSINLVVGTESRGLQNSEVGKTIEEALATAKEDTIALSLLKMDPKSWLEKYLTNSLHQPVRLPIDLSINIVEQGDQELVIVVSEYVPTKLAETSTFPELDLKEVLNNVTNGNTCNCWTNFNCWHINPLVNFCFPDLSRTGPIQKGEK